MFCSESESSSDTDISAEDVVCDKIQSLSSSVSSDEDLEGGEFDVN